MPETLRGGGRRPTVPPRVPTPPAGATVPASPGSSTVVGQRPTAVVDSFEADRGRGTVPAQSQGVGSLPSQLPPEQQKYLKEVFADPSSFIHLPKAVQHDKKFVLAALNSNGDVLEFVPKLFKVTLETVMAAVKRSPAALDHAGAALKKDPAVLEEVLARDESLLSKVPKKLLADKAFLARCAIRNPYLLDELEDKGQALRQAFPQVREAEASFKKALTDLHLDTVGGFFVDRVALRELMENRDNPGHNDPRPVAVAVFGTDDWNGVLHHNISTLLKLTQSYRVMYYSAASDTEFLEAMKKGTAAKEAELVVIGGHGNQRLLAFGADDPAFSEEANEGFYLDRSDSAQLQDAGFGARIKKGANIVLCACSTGEGSKNAENLANFLGDAVPHASIHAPTKPVKGVAMVTNHLGLFDRAFGGRGEDSYVIPAKVRR